MKHLRLIINADDFGLHPDVNRGIIAGHREGCLTSTTVMPGGAAFEQAAILAQEHAGLGVGVHLTLVADRPVLPPSEIPSLIEQGGRFYRHYPSFIKRYFAGQVHKEDIRRELTAQVSKASQAGIAISHFDSHQHLHILPGVIDIVLALAERFNVKAIRIPSEGYLFTGGYPATVGRWLGRGGLTALSMTARRKAQKRGIAVTDHFFGMLAGGNMREQYLLNVINRLPSGTSEIMLHPGADTPRLSEVYGWGYNWEAELAAVTSGLVRERLRERGIELITFRELSG